MPKLTYVVGSGGETRSVDVGDSCSIGSLPGNTILLDATQGVSRRHCQVIKIAHGYELNDLGSTNGTKLNGETVKRGKLKNGDRIEVGKVVLTFDDGSGAAVGGEEEISLEEPAGASAAPAPSARGGGGGGGAASDQCLLVFAGGDKDGQKIPLDKPRITFGRNSKNVVVLNDNGASGFHAEIAREGGAYVLRDLGSTNGTMVDGEPVSETALQHGARIRMGNSRFVFVDPTVSDFEKAMAAVDDLGSEWGMLRAEMDMTRVQKARRSQMVTTLVLLLVVLGGGAFVYVNRDKITGRKPDLTDVAGNKVADFSFEERAGADWKARPGTPTKASIAGKSDGAAKQGAAFYAVMRDGPGGTAAAAQSSVDSLFTVNLGHAAEFGAAVRAGGGAMGGVRIVWLDKPDATGREIGRDSSGLSSASDWQPVKGAAMPPDGARAARLELVNAASGTAYFDDVFLVWGGSNAGGGSAKDGPLSLSATADAQATIARGDAKLLVAGAVVGGALTADAVDNPSLRGDRAGSRTVETGGLSASGRYVDPATNQSENFRIDLTASGGRYVDVHGQWKGGEPAWVAVLPDEFVAAGIGVKTESDFRRASEPRLFDKVQDVAFGGPHRFKVSRGEKGGPLRMALYRVGDQWEVAFGATDGNLQIRIDTDSTALTAEVDKLKQEADSAKQHRDFGSAIGKFQQLESAYPSNSLEAAGAKDERTRIEESGKTRVAELEKKAVGAIQFHDAKDLAEVKTLAADLAREFAGHPFGKSAEEVARRVDAASAADRLATDERLAAPLLKKADDFVAHTEMREGRREDAPMKHLAKAFYNEIVQRFPDTEAARKAREALSKL